MGKTLVSGTVQELGPGHSKANSTLRSYVEIDGKRYKNLHIPDELETTIQPGRTIDMVISRGILSADGIYIARNEDGRVIKTINAANVFTVMLVYLVALGLLITVASVFGAYALTGDIDPERDVAIGFGISIALIYFGHKSMLGLEKALGLSKAEIKANTSPKARSGKRLVVLGVGLLVLDAILYFTGDISDGVAFTASVIDGTHTYWLIPQSWILPPILLLLLFGFIRLNKADN